MLYRFIRIWVIAISEFNKDKCGEKASALTYFSVLSIVPVLALAFGIATLFGLEQYLNNELSKYFAGQEDVLKYMLTFAQKMLSTSSGGIISGISAVFLIYAVGRLMNNIEVAFNHIWNTKKGRSLRRKVTDYISVILLGPLILIISNSLSFYISTSIEGLTTTISLLGYFKPMMLVFIKLVPYVLMWFLLFLFYIVFPNTLVKSTPALVAGVLAGTVYQFMQFLWLGGQVYLSRYSVIYGSFAALPLFLIWLQISWMILLFGAEFAFAIQNVNNWSHDTEALRMNMKSKRKITLLVLKKIISFFLENDRAVGFEELCQRMNIPRRFIREVLEELVESGVVSRMVNEQDDDEYFQPGMDVQKIDVYTVFERMGKKGLDYLPQEEMNESYKTVSQAIAEMDEDLRKSTSNKLIKDM